MARERKLTFTTKTPFINNSWVRDALSEFLATFCFVLLLSASAAHEILAGWHAMSGFSLSVIAGLSLAMVIYISGNASGAYSNPGISLMFALIGKLQWKKFPMYVLVELLASYASCAVVYGIYHDNIVSRDGGASSVIGPNSTAAIFSTFPASTYVSKSSMFFEVMTGHFLVVLFTIAIADPFNMAVSTALQPIAMGFGVIVVCGSLDTNTGCAINPAKDFASRVFLFSVGYDAEVFTYWDYWMWVSPVACTAGSILATAVYQVFVGLQFPSKYKVEQVELTKIKNNDGHDD